MIQCNKSVFEKRIPQILPDSFVQYYEPKHEINKKYFYLSFHIVHNVDIA